MTGKEERSAEAANKPTNPPRTLLEQYRIAVDLYKHEDSLNWTKLNYLLAINTGLCAIMGDSFGNSAVNEAALPRLT